MSANPLQGIQVINSVNPCSSTPLHQPIYPYHYLGFPVLPRPRHLYSPPTLSALARSSSLHLPHPLTWNLDSPLPGSTHPLLRLQEKVENCDYKDFPGAPPNAPPRFLLTSSSPSFRRSSLLLPSSSRPTLAACNLLTTPLFCLPFCPLAAVLFRSFLYFSFFPVFSWSFPPAVSRSSSVRGALLLGLKL